MEPAIITKVYLNSGGDPPFTLAISVDILIDLHARLISGTVGHPEEIDNP